MPDPISWSQDLPYFAAGFLVAYLLGSIPFGLLLTKFSGAGDIREIGSGNIGATNVLRTGRKGLAIATLLLDAAKGCVAVLIGQSFGPDLAIIAAWGAVLGHLFPVWLKFKGGKGGATALGVGIGLVPILALYAGLTWLAVAILLRYSSLATLLAIAAAPIYAWLLGYHQIAEAFVPIALLIWLKHHANIRRLLAGEESKIKLKSA
ncbi:MAG: glycerol-3-phosphate 1-O-acyltransferase PlsY [Pseudomonadota bacterium]|nr:acyl-phosphate glycerol 3-phosphate acyltransferase [Rhodospirillaceae bacterium]MEE3093831.1 glycerol-3-phosphate 1-O-acyltransferase PlsY [Pseudomonadota bacterium]